MRKGWEEKGKRARWIIGCRGKEVKRGVIGRGIGIGNCDRLGIKNS